MRNAAVYLLLIAVLGLQSCKSFKGYSITGAVKNGENVKVYLEDIASNELTVIDTAVVHNGTFQLKNYASNGLYRLRFGDKDGIFLYIHEQDKLEISADLEKLSAYIVSGSKDCQVIKDFTSEIDRQLLAQDSLYAKVERADDSDKTLLMDALNNSQKEYISYIKQFVSSTPNKEISAFALNFLGPALQQEMPYLLAITDSLHTAAPDSKYINQWYSSLQQYRESMLADESSGIPVGAEAPAIVLADPNGDTISLSNLRGKFVLLDFWASWCGPCRHENPNVVRLYKKFHPKGLEIFSVSLDSDISPWVNAIKKDGLIWPNHGYDFGGWNSRPAQDYKVTSIPQTYLLDKEGKVIAKNLRGELLEQKLQEIFADSTSVLN